MDQFCEELKDTMDGFIVMHSLDENHSKTQLELKEELNFDSISISIILKSKYNEDDELLTITASSIRKQIEAKTRNSIVFKNMKVKRRYLKIGDYAYITLKDQNDVLVFIQEYLQAYRSIFSWR